MQAGLHKAGSLGGEEQIVVNGRRQTPLQALALATQEQVMVKQTSMDVEAQLSRLKQAKAMRHKTGDEVFNLDDPVFADFWPDFHKSDGVKSNTTLHPELRKMLYSNLREPEAHASFNIKDEESAQHYEHMQTMALGYYKAKE